jgi:GDSL-like lipase/acylhydrolase family protein
MALGATGLGVALVGSLSETAVAATAIQLGPLPVIPNVLLLGDSYTEGVGASVKTNGYAYKVGAPLNWKMTIDGKGGSGYCNPTTYGAGNYSTRLGKKTGVFDLVVLQGTSNDEKSVNGVPVYDNATLSAAIQTTLDLVRTRFPLAQILMMGPANPYGSASADRLRVNDVLVQAATTNAVPYLNPIAEKWFLSGDGSSFADSTSGHPNNVGHLHIRSLFVRDVQALTVS